MKMDEVGRREITLATRQHIADLGITREDIRAMVQEVVKTEVDKAIDRLRFDISVHLNKGMITQNATNEFLRTHGKNIAEAVARDITSRLKLKDPADDFSKPASALQGSF